MKSSRVPGMRRLLPAALAVAMASGEGGTCSTEEVSLTGFDAMGPFYVPDSPITKLFAPERELRNLENVLRMEGQVMGNDCVPLSGAVVEGWYAGQDENGGGIYLDTAYRGQTIADECGTFDHISTFPAVYPSRPIPHMHYRVSTREGDELLVTQMYFEGLIPDRYDPPSAQIVAVTEDDDGSRSAFFKIVVDIPGNAEHAALCEAGTLWSSSSSGLSPTNNSTAAVPPVQASSSAHMIVVSVNLLFISWVALWMCEP